MAHAAVKTIVSADGLRRVEIYSRADGTFGFREDAWSLDELVWLPFGRYSEAHCDSSERAESEARSRVAWLANSNS